MAQNIALNPMFIGFVGYGRAGTEWNTDFVPGRVRYIFRNRRNAGTLRKFPFRNKVY